PLVLRLRPRRGRGCDHSPRREYRLQRTARDALTPKRTRASKNGGERGFAPLFWFAAALQSISTCPQTKDRCRLANEFAYDGPRPVINRLKSVYTKTEQPQ